jgi:hypothetical protein
MALKGDVLTPNTLDDGGTNADELIKHKARMVTKSLLMVNLRAQ